MEAKKFHMMSEALHQPAAVPEYEDEGSGQDSSESVGKVGSGSSSDECAGNLLQCLFGVPICQAMDDLKWCCKPSRWCIITLLCCTAVILAGLLLGMYVEGWSLLTSLYVLMQVVTTIGYGDVTVQHEGMKLFMSFYVLCVLVMFSHLINLFVQGWLRRQVGLLQDFFAQKEEKERQERRARHLPTDQRPRLQSFPMRKNMSVYEATVRRGGWKQLLAPSFLLAAAITIGTFFYAYMEPCSCSYGATWMEDCDPTSIETCRASGGFEKNLLDCFYMSVITVTTVGFGDHSPRSWKGRLFSLVWCIFGVGCCINWLRSVTELLIERHRWQEFDYAHMNLNERIFKKMDSERTGYLTRHEYLGYCLIKYGFVSKSILDYLNEQFDEMDPRGTNHVTFQQLMARQMAMQEAETLRSSARAPR